MPSKSKSKSKSKSSSSSSVSRAKRLVSAAVRERKKKNAVRKITRVGKYTYYVTLPKDEVLELGWREHQKVTVRRVGDKLIIEDWKR